MNWLNIKTQQIRSSSTSKLNSINSSNSSFLAAEKIYLQEYLQTCPVTEELLNTEGQLLQILNFLEKIAIPEFSQAVDLTDFPDSLKQLLKSLFAEIPRIKNASQRILNIVKSPRFLLSDFLNKETQFSQIIRIYREFMIRQTELYANV